MKTKAYAFSAIALALTTGAWWSAVGPDASASTLPLRPIVVESPSNLHAVDDVDDVVEPRLMTVYKSPACGCCDGWIEHLRKHGFTVEVVESQALMALKANLGVPSELTSCHTGVIGGRVVEGHVPADAIQAFLADEDLAEALGVAVPGMPLGSPGMEVAGRPAVPYDILAFHADGSTEVVESR